MCFNLTSRVPGPRSYLDFAAARVVECYRMRGEGESEGMVSPPPGDSPLRVRRFGNYTLIKKLATGGMAEIWLSTQSGIANFRRFVVIKKILSHLSEQESFVKMFLDEARTCAQLTHPNIVQIYDLGRVATTYYIAMEYIAGENLAALAWRAMKRGGPLAPNYAARIICDSAKALHYAHQMRGNDGRPLEIVHRDVSPQNVLVTYEGEVKVVDFGIAKAASKSEQTRTGMLKGKFSYMSPEQCMGQPLDGRSDVFALGIVLYELVTGKRLFKHDSELMILEMITRRSIVPPSQVVPELPKGIEAIIMKALEKDLALRFRSAQEMQIALDEYLRGEPKPTSSNELGTLMRALFNDKIEEKRKLVEAASKNEFVYGSGEGEEENTDQKQPPRPGSTRGARTPSVAGAMPPGSRLQPLPLNTPAPRPTSYSYVQPPRSRSTPGAPIDENGPQAMMVPSGAEGMPPGAASPSWNSFPMAPQLTPTNLRPPGAMASGAMAPGMMPPGMSPAMSYAGYAVAPPPPRANWLARVLIVFAVSVIGAAVWIVMFGRAPTPLPVKRGQVTISSQPSGARVFVDGKLVTDANNAPILTPLTVKQLEYGSNYQLRLDLEGYRTADRPVLMSDENNGKEMVVPMDPLPAEIAVAVRGDSPETVAIYFGGERIGVGPELRKSAAPGPLAISTDAPGRTCMMKPERLEARPGKIERVEIECTKKRGSYGGGGGGGLGGGGSSTSGQGHTPPIDDGAREPPTNTDSPPIAKANGCAQTPQLPNGFLTLDTKPYAKLYANGKLLGETPVSRVALPSGCTELRAVALENGKEATFRVEIQPGTVGVFHFDF